jgi:hypothetical protein
MSWGYEKEDLERNTGRIYNDLQSGFISPNISKRY